VIDASDPGFQRQIEVTDEVLEEIGASTLPRIRIFNKIDHVGDTAAQSELEASLRINYPSCIVMSARRSEDITNLRHMIITFLQQDMIEAELFLPWSSQQLRAEIYSNCQVLVERSDNDGATIRVRGQPNSVKILQDQFSRIA
jgi:GTP-binding protein HflX